jgi:hypothetical protein
MLRRIPERERKGTDKVLSAMGAPPLVRPQNELAVGHTALSMGRLAMGRPVFRRSVFRRSVFKPLRSGCHAVWFANLQLTHELRPVIDPGIGHEDDGSRVVASRLHVMT